MGAIGMGSFRGVNFYVKGADSGIGRRTVIHEFPGSDIGAGEDLGQRVRRYTLECYVLGGGYMAQRDKLIKAFETAGPGMLIHPFWGNFVVTVDGEVKVQESYDYGGMARFTLSVAQVGTLAWQFQRPDTYGSVLTASAGLLSAVTAGFATAFAVVGAVQSVVQAAANTINGVASTLNSIKGSINSVFQTIDNVADAIQNFADTVSSLIMLPGQLASELSGIVSQTIGSIENIGSAFDSYFANGETPGSSIAPSLAPSAVTPASGDARAAYLLSAANTLTSSMNALPTVTGTSGAALQTAANQAAVQLLVNASAVAAVCRVAATIPYGSATTALVMMTTLVGQIDTLTEQTTDDATYAALVQLRAAIFAYLAQTATSLPNEVSYTPPQTVPALVLAQQLYGSPALADDLLARNNVIDPTAIPGGIAIEVLSG